MEDRQIETVSPWIAACWVGGFIAWMAFYLLVIRPAFNQWIVNYVSGYPAMLHLFPILGVPIAIGWLIGALKKK